MIAFLDSGYGGKTVMSEVVKVLPQYDYVYLGDNFRAPYGNLSDEKIYELSSRAVDFLFARGVRVIIIACNTICSVALRRLQKEKLVDLGITDRKILGIIRPVIEEASRLSERNIGLIGTRTTIQSGVYATELRKINPQLKIYDRACPLLVPLIEENWHRTPEAKKILKKYLLPIKSANIESIILGCTHYPFMTSQIARILGKNCQIINPGPIVAESFASYLQRHPEIESLLTRTGQKQYLTTDCSERFKNVIANLLGKQLTDVQQVFF